MSRVAPLRKAGAPALEAEVAESLSGIWAALHSETPIRLLPCDIHTLKMAALAADDELVSHLLLTKLRLARFVPPDRAPASLVAMNSVLEFSFDGERAFGQLAHPSASGASDGISLLSRLGAGVVGLEAGQWVLWPDGEGILRRLEIHRVENCSGLVAWVQRPVPGALS